MHELGKTIPMSPSESRNYTEMLANAFGIGTRQLVATVAELSQPTVPLNLMPKLTSAQNATASTGNHIPKIDRSAHGAYFI